MAFFKCGAPSKDDIVDLAEVDDEPVSSTSAPVAAGGGSDRADMDERDAIAASGHGSGGSGAGSSGALRPVAAVFAIAAGASAAAGGSLPSAAPLLKGAASEAAARMGEEWSAALGSQLRAAWFRSLCDFVEGERSSGPVYPPEEDTFSALSLCPPNAVRVVILGQDPYHGPGQAHGLAFSVQDGVPPPPSLKNILKEVHEDVGTKPASHGSLVSWARQGVLLLNTVLTVRKAKAHSHKGKGWEKLTGAVVKHLSERQKGVVWMLWGKPAQVLGSKVSRVRHLVLEAPHPSPLSAYRGFFGSKHFSQANRYLAEARKAEIDWQIQDESGLHYIIDRGLLYPAYSGASKFEPTGAWTNDWPGCLEMAETDGMTHGTGANM